MRLLFIALLASGCVEVEVACFNSASISCASNCTALCAVVDDGGGVWTSNWDATCETLCWDNNRPRFGFSRDGGTKDGGR